jgi:serine/threonine protein kinase
VQDVLAEKYHFPKEEAQAVADFMMPLLDFDPKTRATAQDALESNWLKV